MSLEELPYDILREIFCHLIRDSKSYISLASTCKRLCQISIDLSRSSIWSETRPITFIVTRGDDFKRKLLILFDSPYRCYSSLEFQDIWFLESKESIGSLSEAIRESMNLNSAITELKLNSLVELILSRVDITLDMLNILLEQLPNISYLSLRTANILDKPGEILNLPRKGTKGKLPIYKLKELGLKRYWHSPLNDELFAYFLYNFPSETLDMTKSYIVCSARIVRRFYQGRDILTNPSSSIITFEMIYEYLRRHKSIIRNFIASETNITLSALKRLLQDEELRNMKIVVERISEFKYMGEELLFRELGADSMARVNFGDL